MTHNDGKGRPRHDGSQDRINESQSDADSNPRLDAALRYAARGWFVFPVHGVVVGECDCGIETCSKPGKHPRTARGLKDATTDREIIRRWWKNWPNANPGINCELSNLAVLDIDPDKGGDDSLAELEREHGELPATVRSITGGGGAHTLFKRPAGGFPTDVGVRPGLDRRGDKNGYIVAPPSLHVSARHYEWEAGFGPDEIELAPAPAWLRELKKAPRPRGDGAGGKQRGASGDGRIPEGERNDALTRKAGKLRWAGFNENEILSALRTINDDRCDPPLGEDEVAGIAHSVAGYPPGDNRNGGPGEGPPDDSEGDRPTIWVNNKQLHEIANEAWRVVEQNNTPEPAWFLHGTAIADIQRDKRTGDPYVHHLDRAMVKGAIDRLARWRKRTAKGVSAARPPLDVVEDMMALPGDCLPALLGIVAMPVLSSDGHIDMTPGYQPANQLWYNPPRYRIPALPENPSPADIAKAKGLLFKEWLGDFPFVDEASRLHAVAVALTPVIRGVVLPNLAPLFLYEAAAEGTGKGLCAHTASIIVWGREIPARAYNENSESMRKLITSILREAPVYGLWDNLSGAIYSPELEALLTTPTWADRLLGKSTDLRLPNTTTWTATANNAFLSRDLIRRTVLIGMDAEMENPSDRTNFRHPLLEQHVLRTRHHYIWALLVLVQHWAASGMPQWDGVPMGSYESWSMNMGGLLECADLGGFLGNINQLRGRDTSGQEWRRLVFIWWDRYKDTPVSAKELAELAARGEVSLKLLERTRFDKDGNMDIGTPIRMADELKKLANKRFGDFKILVLGKDSHAKSLRFRLDFKGLEPASGGVWG